MGKRSSDRLTESLKRLFCGSFGVDGGAEDAEFVGGGEDFEAAALQRAHFHHFVEQAVEQAGINEGCVRAGDEERAWTAHVDAGGSGGGEGAMAKRDEFGAAGVAGARVFKDFFRLEVEEAHAHRAAAENSFEVAFAAAAAETFLRIECDHGVAAFPHAFAGGIPAEADSVAERPDARELVKFALRGRNARGHGVGVIENVYGNSRGFASKRRRKHGLQREAFHLLQVGRFLDDAVANDPRKADADGFEFFSACHFFDEPANSFRNVGRRHGLQRVERLRRVGKKFERADDFVGVHQARRDMFLH